MLGAIAGDIIGSVYEFANIKTKAFPLFAEACEFTDDTILSVAIADVLLNGGDYVTAFKQYYRRYPAPRGRYGKRFCEWASSAATEPYNSWGNGSAMRVSPVGFAGTELAAVLQEAKCTAAVTHNHPEGVKGAQAVAAAVWLARQGEAKAAIQTYIETSFGYDLSFTLDAIRPTYRFDVSCQGSVPQAIRAFLESTDFEDAIRNAISIGGDSDTIACIAGGIAEAFYGGVPAAIAETTLTYLNPQLRQVVEAFVAQVNAEK